MAVYVDGAHWRLGRMRMCHLVADTLDELHAMADTIGVDRRHFQDKPGRPHYDVCMSKRALAIAAGATPVSSRQLVRILRDRGGTIRTPFDTLRHPSQKSQP